MEAEERARQSGWTPLEGFKGDPDKWVDADAWNERTDSVMPILKATNLRLEEALETTKNELGATKQELLNLKKTMQLIYLDGD